MRTVKSKLSLPRENCAATDAVSEEELRGIVECLSYPRHYEYNSAANRMARDWLVTRLNSLALETSLQGEFDNVVAESPAINPVANQAAYLTCLPLKYFFARCGDFCNRLISVLASAVNLPFSRLDGRLLS